MTPQEALTRVIEHREIFREEMLSLMRRIMSGEVSASLIAAILIGLRVKKETIGEIAAAAEVMREFATHVPVPDEPSLIDTCGTGGDSAHSFNISTAAMFVAAAAGASSLAGGIYWWGAGMAIAVGYFVLVYTMFRGKVSSAHH